MGYTLGQAAKAVGMSKTSILRSIKTGRISAGRDEFDGPSSPANCIGFTRPWRPKPSRPEAIRQLLTDILRKGPRVSTGAARNAKLRRTQFLLQPDDYCERRIHAFKEL
jgi:hypothetical protein